MPAITPSDATFERGRWDAAEIVRERDNAALTAPIRGPDPCQMRCSNARTPVTH